MNKKYFADKFFSSFFSLMMYEVKNEGNTSVLVFNTNQKEIGKPRRETNFFTEKMDFLSFLIDRMTKNTPFMVDKSIFIQKKI